MATQQPLPPLSMKPIQSRNIQCKVIYDFEAKEKQELSVQCGECVEVVKRYKDGWSWCIVMREEHESYGLIPTAYLHEVQQATPSDHPLSHQHSVLHNIAKIIQQDANSTSMNDKNDTCHTDEEEQSGHMTTLRRQENNQTNNTQIVLVDEDGMVSDILTHSELNHGIDEIVESDDLDTSTTTFTTITTPNTTTTTNSTSKDKTKKTTKFLKRLGSFFQKPSSEKNNHLSSKPQENETTTLKPQLSMTNLKKNPFNTVRISKPTMNSISQQQELFPNHLTLQPQKRNAPSSRISPLDIKTSIELMSQFEKTQHVCNTSKRKSQDSNHIASSSHHHPTVRDSFNIFSKHRRSRKKNSLTSDRAIEILLNQLECFKRRRQFTLYIKKDEGLKKQRRRLDLIKETIETERTYVRLLKTFIEVFYYPIIHDSGSAKGVLRKETSTTLFSNIEQIYQINHTLLNDWEREFEMHYPFIQIGSAFSQICPFLKAYTIYINNFDKAQETFEKLRDKDKKFKEFLHECYRKQQTKGHQLGGFLILPVQRIPRYKMLIQEILNLTSQDHVEYEILKKCSVEIESIASYVNDEKKKVEQNQVVFEVQHLVQKHYGSFIQPNRKFVRRGTMRIKIITHHIEQQLMDGRCSKSIRPVSLTDIMNSMVCKEAKFDIFLFTDVLVLIERDKSKNSNHSSQILNADNLHFIFLQFVDCRDFTKYSPRQSQREFIDSPNSLLTNHNQKRSNIHLKDNLITRVENEDCTFTLEALIKSVKTEYTFQCATVNDKMTWMSNIKDCLESISRSNVSKGIEQDMFIIGKERASLNRIAKYKLEEHQKLEKSNLMKISYLTQLDQHLSKKKQQLAKLQKEISIYEMDKEQVLSDVKYVTDKKHKIREDLKSYYASIQEKDLACMKLLNEEHAFKLVFDDVPSVDIQAAYSYMTNPSRKTISTSNQSNEESSESP